VLRAALSKAATERRREVKTQPELLGRAAKPVERRLIRMARGGGGFRQELAKHLQNTRLYQGLETEKIFTALVIASLSGQPVQATEIGAALEDRDRRLLFEILFEEANEPTWEEAMSCIEALQHRQSERELATCSAASRQTLAHLNSAAAGEKTGIDASPRRGTLKAAAYETSSEDLRRRMTQAEIARIPVGSQIQSSSLGRTARPHP